MKIGKGNLWDQEGKSDLLLVTSNSYIRKDGTLVMGRGAALEASKRYPKVPELAGKHIKHYARHLGEYLLITKTSGPSLLFEWPERFGLFQVKRHFRDAADPELIRRSTTALIHLIRSSEIRRIDMNFPGIGLGGLPMNKVLPIVEDLPDCVTLWMCKELPHG